MVDNLNKGHIHYLAPAKESLLLVDTGVFTNAGDFIQKQPIGLQQNIPLSASVTTGLDKLQYNNIYFNNDFFTFTYKNCGIGVAIACFNKQHQELYFVIYPIFLPRICVTLAQRLSTAGQTTVQSFPSTISFEEYKFLLQQFVYYLNMGWTGYGNITNPSGFQTKPNLNLTTPYFYAKNGKGNFTDVGSEISGNPYMPVIADDVTNPNPPLLWDLGPNLEIMLKFNPAADGNTLQDNVMFGVNLISLRDYMATAPLISMKGNGVNPITAYLGNQSFSAPSLSFEYGGGWCGEGVFATGFGQKRIEKNDSIYDYGGGGYYDGYTEAERLSLFEDTKLPRITVNNASSTDFVNLCVKHKLVMKPYGLIFAQKVTSFLSSRYYTVSSDILTMSAQRSVLSNNPNIPKTTIGSFFDSLLDKRTFQSLLSSSFRPSFLGIGANPVSKINPMHSVQTIDLKVYDEWGNTITSFNTLNYSKSQYGNFYSGFATDVVQNNFEYVGLFLEGEGPGGGPIPVASLPLWYQLLNPNPTILSNGETIFCNKTWNNMYAPMLFFNGVSSTQSFITQPNFNSNIPVSSPITHFCRMLSSF